MSELQTLILEEDISPKPILKLTKSGFEKFKKIKGCKTIRMHVTRGQHTYYDGRKKNKDDYFLGFKIETDQYDFIYLIEEED
jgi:hypothetical protein